VVLLGQRLLHDALVEEPEREHLGQDAPRLVVDERDGQLAARHRVEELPPEVPRRGELHVETCCRGRVGPVRPTPIAQHEPLEPHLALQDRADEQRVLAIVDAVHAVEAAHCAGHVSVPDRRLERAEIELPHRLLVDADVEREPLGLLSVHGEVLRICKHGRRLDALDEGHHEARRQERIFAETLERAPRERHAGEIDRRS
jgi:hypothetical protein